MNPNYLSQEEMDVFTAYKRMSSDKEAVFIHIPKTAGSSIRQTLGFNEPIHSDKRFTKHYKYQEVEAFLSPDCLKRSFTFAFVRNPWDRLYSAFLYRRRMVLAGEIKHKENEQKVKGSVKDFDTWGRFLSDRKRPTGGVLTVPQVNWITNLEGEINLDFLGRYETVEADYAKVCQMLQVKHEPLRKENISKRERDYRPVYNDFLRDFVAEHYKEDIETFDYRF